MTTPKNRRNLLCSSAFSKSNWYQDERGEEAATAATSESGSLLSDTPRVTTHDPHLPPAVLPLSKADVAAL